ncbi:DEAD box RNA helicase, partial [Striga asiatica]
MGRDMSDLAAGMEDIREALQTLMRREQTNRDGPDHRDGGRGGQRGGRGGRGHARFGGGRRAPNSTGLTGFPSAGPSTSTAVGIGTASAGMEGSRAGGGPRCFSCGEAGHRQSACPRRNSSRALLADDFDGSAE